MREEKKKIKKMDILLKLYLGSYVSFDYEFFFMIFDCKKFFLKLLVFYCM